MRKNWISAEDTDELLEKMDIPGGVKMVLAEGNAPKDLIPECQAQLARFRVLMPEVDTPQQCAELVAELALVVVQLIAVITAFTVGTDGPKLEEPGS